MLTIHESRRICFPVGSSALTEGTRVILNSSGELDKAGVGLSIGVALADYAANAEEATVLCYGPSIAFECASAVTVGDLLYTAATGEVDDTGVDAIPYIAGETGADGDIITAYRVEGSIAPYSTSEVAVAADALAIPITARYVAKTTGADAEALTLADGVAVGQRLNINLEVDGGGDGTLTPTTPSGFATIVFADAGDYAELEWTGSAWILISHGGVAAPPVITI